MAAKNDKRLKRYYKIVDAYLQSVAIELSQYSKHKSTVVTDENKGTVTLTIPAHIQFAKYGRGPGKKPPFENIYKWVKEEGIKFENTTQEGTAFTIQYSIGKKGTLNWVPNAPDVIEETLEAKYVTFQNFFDNEIGASMDEFINQLFSKVEIVKHKK
jgi:hypothetical protein